MWTTLTEVYHITLEEVEVEQCRTVIRFSRYTGYSVGMLQFGYKT
jgi:hypothetical protein